MTDFRVTFEKKSYLRSGFLKSRLSFPHRAASGLRVPYVGGNANNGGNYGPEYVNVNNGVSTTNVNTGSPLNFSARFSVSLPCSKRNETAPHGGK